jgi:hypothetical protein
MSTEDFEIVDYFRGLLDHEAGCQSVNCPSCAAVERIVEAIRQRLFGSTIYSIEGSPAIDRQDPAESAKLPTHRRTHSVR